MGPYTVYRHVNKETGGVYVGITCRPVEVRWRNGNAYKTCQRFYRAINKYGWDGFTHEVLFAGLSKEDAQRKEIELIATYRETGHECYNILAGGNLSRSGGTNAGARQGEDKSRQHRQENARRTT